MINRFLPPANLHTPEELLGNAEALFAADNPKMLRASVLEAITALEAYVQETVFTALEGKLDSLLVTWLQDKTKMDFDSRLWVFAPIAMGRPVDKASALWSDYKKAKDIRNKITHSGIVVAQSDARFVIDTVYNWLAYLGTTVELGLSLLKLKEYVEANRIPVPNSSVGARLIKDYFGRTGAMDYQAQTLISGPEYPVRPDIVLTLGRLTTLIEAKLSEPRQLKSTVEKAKQQLAKYLQVSDFTQGANVIFHEGKVPEKFQTVQRYKIIYSPNDIRDIYTVVIKAGR